MRLVPAKYDDDILAKMLLLYGDNVKLCSNCKFLTINSFCITNEMDIDEGDENRSVCKNWRQLHSKDW